MANEKEKAAFYELKRRMEGDMESDLYEDDNIFYRFLIARDFKIDAAEKMLREHLEWRKINDVENISKFESPEVLKRYCPMNFIGFSKEDYVVRYADVGNADLRGILSCCTPEECTKFTIKIYEEDMMQLKKRSKKLGKVLDKFIYIENLENFSLAKATDKLIISLWIFWTNMYLNNYPETLYGFYCINAPSFYGLFYSLLKPFLPSKVSKKIHIYRDNSWKKDLLEIIDAEVLPAFLGGKKTDPDGNPLCNTFINHGGLVPEEYYCRTKQSFTNLPDVRRELVPRKAKHEVFHEIKEPGTILKWEFLLTSRDIKFGIIVYQNRDGKKTEVVPLQKKYVEEFTESGFHKCKNIGTYIVVFDNSYSILRSKEIFYKIQILDPRNVT